MPGFCPLFSSSKANSSVFFGKSGSIVVDMGCSYKSFLFALSECGQELSDIKALCITHDHSDHIAGLKTFLKNNSIPLIIAEQTANSLIDKNIISPNTDIIIADECDIVIGDISIKRFRTSHDSPGAGGYIMSFDGEKYVGICTDTGYLTDDAVKSLKKCKSVIIESNHDISMLKNGPYPPALKMRILSDLGHLSNSSCAAVLPELIKNGTTRFVLGHLSQHNNTPMLAQQASTLSLKTVGAQDGIDYLLSVAKPGNNEVILY